MYHHVPSVVFLDVLPGTLIVLVYAIARDDAAAFVTTHVPVRT